MARNKRTILLIVGATLVALLALWEVGTWLVFGAVVSPFPTSCTIGITGTAANVTLSGIGADQACSKVVEQYSVQTYHMTSGTSQGAEMCEGDIREGQFNLHYLVRDTGMLNLVGNYLCSNLRNGMISFDPQQATPTPTVTESPQQSALNTVSSLDPQMFSSVGAGSVTNNLHPVKAPVLKGADGKPKILYVGGEYCPYCAAQRWGMIAALSRFGTLSQVNALTSSEDSIPTFTFHNSTYTSQYIDFVAKETSDNNQQALDTLTPTEQQIFQAYDTAQYMGSGATSGSIPFISIANQYVSQGSYYSPTILQGHSYQDISQQLKDPNNDIADGVVGAANYLMAAICKVTNNQPSNVCTAKPVPSLQSSLSTTSQVAPRAPQLAIVPSMTAVDARWQV